MVYTLGNGHWICRSCFPCGKLSFTCKDEVATFCVVVMVFILSCSLSDDRGDRGDTW
jgi:hypothetical protein